MKTYLCMILIVGILTSGVNGQPSKPFRPATSSIQDHLNPPEESALTPSELAVPQSGKIQQKFLRVINQLKSIAQATLAGLPTGPDGQGSPWYSKCQSYKSGLDTVGASCLQSDCFAMIPHISALQAARASDAPEFAHKFAGLANGFSTVLVHAIERHILDQNGTVSAANLTNFITVFSIEGFLSEGDWEAKQIPIDAAGVLILNPVAAVEYLKTRPWQECEKFLGNKSAADAFSRYAESGNGLAQLKTKYASNQSTVAAKWEELATWVAAQRSQN